MSLCTARVAPEKAVFRPALPLHLQPEFTGEHMTAKLTYSEQLKDPRWQKKRLEILSRDEFTCQSCYDSESTLHVHHKHYHKGRMPWEYEDYELVTLCESCHEAVDQQINKQKQLFAKLNMDGPFSYFEGLGLLAGWANQNCGHDLSEYREESPYMFLLGQLADAIDVFSYRQDALRELLDALMGVGMDARREAVASFIATLKEMQGN